MFARSNEVEFLRERTSSGLAQAKLTESSLIDVKELP
jgi:hypothetical protein